jgi:hypothetical protein
MCITAYVPHPVHVVAAGTTATVEGTARSARNAAQNTTKNDFKDFVDSTSFGYHCTSKLINLSFLPNFQPPLS